MTDPQGRKRTTKGDRTRALILDTALRLFLERGYFETTMRVIAAEAGVSLGNAYYYFKSKEHLIQAFYLRTHHEHLAVCDPMLATERDVEKRLLGVMEAKLATIEPYHQFSGQLFKVAADPDSPLNPFSKESMATRAEATALFERVIEEGTGLRVSKELRPELPNLLWTYHMGVILFWLHDHSAGRRRTRHLVSRTVPLILRIVSLGSLPLVRGLTADGVRFLQELRDDRDGDGDEA